MHDPAYGDERARRLVELLELLRGLGAKNQLFGAPYHPDNDVQEKEPWAE